MSVVQTAELTAALGAEELPGMVRRVCENIGEDNNRTRIDVHVPYAGGWESCKPFYGLG